MLVTPPVSYPGVYIQEVPSDVRTIIGVETSTTAFIGRTLCGPIDEPTVVNNFGDFDRIFGGLWLKSSLSYAVKDFFLNDGIKAIIVRVFNRQADDDEGKAQIKVGDLELEAKDPGVWGNNLKVRVTYLATDEEVDDANSNDGKIARDVARRFVPAGSAEDLVKDFAKALFTLEIIEIAEDGTETLETIRDVTIDQGPRQIRQVLEKESELVRVVGKLNDPPPDVERPPAHPDISDKKQFKSVWEDPAAHTAAAPNSGNDGKAPDDELILGDQAKKEGMYALEKADIFNLLCLPPYDGNDVNDMADVGGSVWGEAAAYCQKKRAMLLVDPPKAWQKDEATKGVPLPGLGAHTNAALYFPYIRKPNLKRDNQVEAFAPCGAVAGVIARTDRTRGVWKAPAGIEATLTTVQDLAVNMTDAENGELNPLAINCLRKIAPVGNVVWGARTTAGNDRLANQWKYLPVRRTALYIEESLVRNVQWAVFEPNDEPLWAQLRLNIGVFMHGLFRQGAFQGQTPRDAYLVQCDSKTTPQADIDRGIVNIIVGFAPLKPAEFVIIYIKQLAGQLTV
jgi:phage tail sheath protein FI